MEPRIRRTIYAAKAVHDITSRDTEVSSWPSNHDIFVNFRGSYQLDPRPICR